MGPLGVISDSKGIPETFWVLKYLYLDLSNGYMDVYMHKNSSGGILSI